MSYAYAQASNVKVGVSTGVFDAILSASPVVQLTLCLLIALSVMSWAIIFSKRKQFSTVKDLNEDFLDLFWKSPSLDTINEKIHQHKNCPIAHVFQAGFNEIQRLAESRQKTSPGSEGSLNKLSGLDNLARSLRKATDSEIAKLESNLNFLATTSNNAPFVGLFGTVWGIMSAFHHIGQTGAANLAVVAPGISEALIATAIGLATALPASAAYNYFLSQIKREELELTNFGSDFLNIAKRNFFKDE